MNKLTDWVVKRIVASDSFASALERALYANGAVDTLGINMKADEMPLDMWGEDGSIEDFLNE